MAIDIIKTLRASKAFSALKDNELRDLLNKFQKIYLHKGQTVFEQGQESDGIFLLVAGKLVTLLRKDKYLEKIVYIVHPGDTIGEMGTFSGEPRTTTAKATENSIVLKLSTKQFRQLCMHHPEIILQALTTLAKRSHSIIDTLSQPQVKKKHLAFLPADDNRNLEPFFQKLQQHLPRLNGVDVLSDYDSEFTNKHPDKESIVALIHKLNVGEKTILYFLSSYETPLSEACLENADIIYIVGDGEEQGRLTGFARQRLRDSTAKVKPELILMHASREEPRNTAKWLKLADFRFYQHIRLQESRDFERLCRFILGKAVGLILGGGGIRSWAHVGVIRALMESKVPIDFIGGTSGGAIVGGYYALHETYKDPEGVLEKLSHATSNTLSWHSLTWPAISLTDAKDYTEALQRVFHKHRIENLWLPFFCVSCKLTSNTAVIHRKGQLWEKIRSSSSIPGVFPPMVIKGKIYLDGGIVNNLPVDTMQKISDNLATIIAVELIHNSPEEKKYHFPPILPFWRVVLSKLGIAYRDYKFPHFIDTFLRSLLVGSSVKQRENSFSADLLIQPDLSSFHLLSITAEQTRQLMQIGYKATLKALQKTHWKNKE